MDAAPLIVDIDRLARQGEQFVGEIPAEVLELGSATNLFEPQGNIHYDLFIQLIDAELLVQGTIRQRFRCTCVRCTDRFEWEGVDPAIMFALQPAENPFVDLTPELRESIILTLPNHPLCRKECLGLCAECGADLNRGPCGCKPPSDNRWGALDGLAINQPTDEG